MSELPEVLEIHGLIQAQAAKTPRAVAVQCEAGALTYDQLDKKANAVAQDLRSRGVAPGNLVGICMERSLEMVVALLGILKSGGAFVPFDPDYPRERLTRMLADAKPVILLADETGASLLGEHDTEMLMVDGAYLSALVEIGLVLFIVTLIVNSLSRLLIWGMAGRTTREAGRQPMTPESAVA